MADGHGSKPHETVALVGLAGLAEPPPVSPG